MILMRYLAAIYEVYSIIVKAGAGWKSSLTLSVDCFCLNEEAIVQQQATRRVLLRLFQTLQVQ